MSVDFPTAYPVGQRLDEAGLARARDIASEMQEPHVYSGDQMVGRLVEALLTEVKESRQLLRECAIVVDDGNPRNELVQRINTYLENA